MTRQTGRLFVRKTLTDVRLDEGMGLKRVLGPWQLTLLGIGCIIGAGVYVMTGVAAANYAGPAVVLSFALAGLSCVSTALCYAELASSLPVSGASYTYAYAALGELAAWGLGWMLSLELGLAGSALAVGAAGYLLSLLGDFGVVPPAALSTSFIQAVPGAHGLRFALGGGVNLIAVGLVAIFAVVLIRGVSHSARLNAAMVTIKIGVLIAFVAFGASHVHTANWRPFIPPNEGGFTYGWPGVLRGASILFFAYLGFEAVATAALEARNPQRDIAIGILASLAVATVLYIAVALTLTGLVPFKSLGVADPVAVAVQAIGWPALTFVIKLGGLVGLCSVLMVNTYAHSRVCLAMSADGLLPRFFSRIHPRFRTPHLGTVAVAGVAALAAALLPISILGDLVSLGTGVVFLTVATSTIWLRSTQPDLPRPFHVPGGGVWIRGVWIGLTPAVSIVLTIAMVGPVLADMAYKASKGDVIPATILVAYVLVGGAFYGLYGLPRSKLGRAWRDGRAAVAAA